MYGNGVYDEVTIEDIERWRDEAYEERKEYDRENLTEEEYEEKYPLIPW